MRIRNILTLFEATSSELKHLSNYHTFLTHRRICLLAAAIDQTTAIERGSVKVKNARSHVRSAVSIKQVA